MSIVLLGSTSGSCTLQEQAVAGSSVLTLPVGTGTVVANNVNSAIVSGTVVASTSGTSIDFTSIPSWAKRITVMFSGVSTSGTSNIIVQLGSTTFTTSGYTGTNQAGNGGVTTTAMTTGFLVATQVAAAGTQHGSVICSNLTANTWTEMGMLSKPESTAAYNFSSGGLVLGGVLDRVRITTVNGTDTFDAGSINILYE